MATPTKLGLELLSSILRSQYQHGDTRADVVGNPVFTWDACEPFGRKAGGIVGALKSAGLVETDDSYADSDERTIWLTAAGYDALVDAALASAPGAYVCSKCGGDCAGECHAANYSHFDY